MDFPKTCYSYCAHGGIPEISEPPADFWPVFAWVWNGRATEDEISRQLRAMLARGIRAVYVLPEPKEFRPKTMPTQLEPDYLSPEFFRLVRFASDEAERLGMKMWLYDEGGWPSGSACGRVVRSEPSLAAKVITAAGGIADSKAYYSEPYPDLLDPAATERFIELTHEGYAAAFGGNIGRRMPLAFTDEPGVSSFMPDALPWTPELEKRFHERWGYELRERLDALFTPGEADAEAKKVRGDYHDLVGEMFAENYFLKIKDWCHAHGMLSAGHINGDHVAVGNVSYGYHHSMRCLRAMDVPGVDVIWRQLFCGENRRESRRNLFFPRYASSAAHQIGGRLSLTESFAIYGAGMTYDQMRWLFAYQAVRGINIFNPMSVCYSYEGCMLASAGRPTFAEQLPGAGDLAVFSLWAARLSYLMSAGSPVADSALYLPLRDIWSGDAAARAMAERFEDTGLELEERGCDFDVIDDDAILAAAIEDGALCIGDARYADIYLPAGAALSGSVSEKLEALRAAGGRVTVCEGEYRVRSAVISDCAELRAARRDLDEGRAYLLFNEADAARRIEVRFPDETAASAWEIDLCSGDRRAVTVKPYNVTLPSGGCVALVFSEDAPETEKTADRVAMEELSGFELRRVRRVTLGRHGFESTPVEEPWRPTELGDWCGRFGEDFSGDAEYAVRFSASEGAEGYLLDLGEVRGSCEVFLNGRSLGAMAFSPFCVSLPPLREQNELVIRVSNTAANIFVHTDFEKWFSKSTIGPYDAVERGFEAESLSSGLFGPVRLLR